ncbi:MAG: hypothetical protein IJY10_02805 [Lachnospiraceae bacterium]|nr:hypothetical protein [Lachnospiraceae bacterium]
MILGIILGLLLAGSFAFMVTMYLVSKSNVLGDTKGSFWTFSKRNLNMISSKDGVSWNTFT